MENATSSAIVRAQKDTKGLRVKSHHVHQSVNCTGIARWASAFVGMDGEVKIARKEHARMIAATMVLASPI